MTTARVIPVRLEAAAYDITIQNGSLAGLGRCVRDVAPSDRVLVAVDERIADDHGAVALASLQQAGFTPTVVRLQASEKRKTLETVRSLYEAMLGGGNAGGRLERADPVVALGGGIVGDVAGFAAATYLRGVPLVHVPTTLLAMVDASIGGKTGVNVALPGDGLGKNMIGAFWQPRAVLADPRVLATLDPRDFRCGLAECVKHAMIADASLLDEIVDNAAALRDLDGAQVTVLIERCARIKVDIVEADEREAAGRALLNLGHTFAHALESRSELDLRHGEAVAIGLAAAAECAVRTGRLDETTRQRIDRALTALELPQRVPGPVNLDDVMRAMHYDKKVAAGRMRLVLPVGLGAAEVTDDVPPDVVTAAWARVGATTGPGR
jgi:3-dehydroquinate synthase